MEFVFKIFFTIVQPVQGLRTTQSRGFLNRGLLQGHIVGGEQAMHIMRICSINNS